MQKITKFSIKGICEFFKILYKIIIGACSSSRFLPWTSVLLACIYVYLPISTLKKPMFSLKQIFSLPLLSHLSKQVVLNKNYLASLNNDDNTYVGQRDYTELRDFCLAAGSPQFDSQHCM